MAPGGSKRSLGETNTLYIETKYPLTGTLGDHETVTEEGVITACAGMGTPGSRQQPKPPHTPGGTTTSPANKSPITTGPNVEDDPDEEPPDEGVEDIVKILVKPDVESEPIVDGKKNKAAKTYIIV